MSRQIKTMSRIIMDCDLMKHRNSGLYHYCLNLGTHVKRILDADGRDEIKFYVPPSERDAFSFPEAVIVEKKWQSKWFRPFLWNCDIWHAPFQSGRMLPRPHQRIKILLTIHDLNVLHEDKPVKEKTESLARTQKLIDASDAIVCISNHTRSDVHNHLAVGSKPIYVIHNGTHHVKKYVLSVSAYTPSRPFIFTLGYVNRKKNFHTLLSLLKNPSIELIIAGRLDEPDYVSSIRTQAQVMGVTDRVHILGPVSEDDKSWYFEHCMAFVLPSLAEGFGAPVVEAMTFGKPVFLSSRTSLPEIGGDVCFYFSDFDPGHMHTVFETGMKSYQEQNLPDRIIARGNSFNWDEKAREYINVYHSLGLEINAPAQLKMKPDEA